MKKSVWTDSVEIPQFKSLGDVVIGGVLCGLLCAYYLHQAGVDYILVDGTS